MTDVRTNPRLPERNLHFPGAWVLRGHCNYYNSGWETKTLAGPHAGFKHRNEELKLLGGLATGPKQTPTKLSFIIPSVCATQRECEFVS